FHAYSQVRYTHRFDWWALGWMLRPVFATTTHRNFSDLRLLNSSFVLASVEFLVTTSAVNLVAYDYFDGYWGCLQRCTPCLFDATDDAMTFCVFVRRFLIRLLRRFLPSASEKPHYQLNHGF